LIKARIKEGREEEVRRLPQEFEEAASDGAGPDRLIIFENQNDPRERYTLIFFENEEKARENERSPQQQDRVRRFQELFEGQEFVDMNVLHERSR